MLVAAEFFLWARDGVSPYCAKLHHANDKRCIFLPWHAAEKAGPVSFTTKRALIIDGRSDGGRSVADIRQPFVTPHATLITALSYEVESPEGFPGGRLSSREL